MSFRAAAGRDGEDAIRDMFANKAGDARRNSKLKAGTNIPWPFDLEIDYARGGWRHLEAAEELEEEAVKDGPEDEQALADFEAQHSSLCSSRLRGRGSSRGRGP